LHLSLLFNYENTHKNFQAHGFLLYLGVGGVADPWQGLGLGTEMLDYVIENAEGMGVETIYGIMFPDNYRAINLMKKMGFALKSLDDRTMQGTLNLKEEEQRVLCEDEKSTEQPQTQLQPEQKQAEAIKALLIVDLQKIKPFSTSYYIFSSGKLYTSWLSRSPTTATFPKILMATRCFTSFDFSMLVAFDSSSTVDGP